MRKILVILTALTASLGVSAQTIPVNPKFGAVSEAEIDLLTYEQDTTAALLLLYTSREVTVGINAAGRLYRDIRVRDRWKVLKESGKDEIDYEIFHSVDNDYVETVRGINVVTYNREDGKVSSQKMSKNYIFDEKYTEGVRRLTFAPENVKVGSVVEVTYVYTSPTVKIGSLRLQAAYPINLAEVKIRYGDFISYNVYSRGSIPMERKRDSHSQTFGSDFHYYEYTDDIRAVDVPALKEDGHCFCPAFYRAAINYDLRGIYIAGVINEDFSRTWEDVDQQMVSAGLIDCFKTPYREAKDWAGELAGLPDETARIAAVRNRIMEKVTWNGKTARYPAHAKTVIKDGSGDSADINALVANALNTLGYKVEPVLVKLRTSGPMIDAMVSMDAFDALILRIVCPNGEVHYLDAPRKDAYVDILDPTYLVTKARLLSLDKKGSWIDLTKELPANKIVENFQMQFQDGVLGGTVRVIADGMDSYSVRRHYHSFDTEDEWIQDTEEDEGIKVTKMSFDGADQYAGRSVINYDFESDQTLGADHLYINLFLSKYHPETAFRSETRTLPVEFPYCHQITYRGAFMIPEGYEVESIPESVSYSCAALGDSKMTFVCRRSGNAVSLIYMMNLDAIFVNSDDYSDLRLFWDELSRIEKSILVLKKI